VTTLYLRRIEISNFRAYGDTFSLSLPGPGVTILTGPDGLGKSTFFDSIAWALTGRVRRLEALTQEELDRGRNSGLLARREEGVPVAQYRVSLEFVNGEAQSHRIERRAVREPERRERFAEFSSHTQQQLIDLLWADSWLHGVSDIGEYLLSRSAAGGGLPAEVITERAIAISAALKAALGVEFALEGAPPPDVLLERLLQAIEQADAVLLERKRVLSQAGEALNAWQQLNSAAVETRTQSSRDTLLRLSAAREKAAQGTAQKSLLVGQNDRHTHELWMIQSYLRDAVKSIKRITELDSRIQSLLLAKQEIERQGPSHLAELSRNQLELEEAQSTREQQPDLENLNEQRASIQARIAQLSSTIQENHRVVIQLEQEILAAQTLLQQHPELLSALGTLPADEAKVLDEAASRWQQWLALGLPGFPDPMALSEQRNTLAEQEAKLQELREQQKRLADAWLALFPPSEGPRPSRDVAWLSSMSTAYPWSRWPALLLDEPLQPQDLSHPAAFIEVLRNLVRDRKYQVILSTHDEAFAEELRREMRGAGIECVTCRYSGLGPTGVLYNTV